MELSNSQLSGVRDRIQMRKYIGSNFEHGHSEVPCMAGSINCLW